MKFVKVENNPILGPSIQSIECGCAGIRVELGSYAHTNDGLPVGLLLHDLGCGHFRDPVIATSIPGLITGTLGPVHTASPPAGAPLPNPPPTCTNCGGLGCMVCFLDAINWLPPGIFGPGKTLGEAVKEEGGCLHQEQTPAEEVSVILDMRTGKYWAESVQGQWDKARADGYRLVKIPKGGL